MKMRVLAVGKFFVFLLVISFKEPTCFGGIRGKGARMDLKPKAIQRLQFSSLHSKRGLFSSVGRVIEISLFKDIIKAILVTGKRRQKPRWLEKNV